MLFRLTPAGDQESESHHERDRGCRGGDMKIRWRRLQVKIRQFAKPQAQARLVIGDELLGYADDGHFRARNEGPVKLRASEVTIRKGHQDSTERVLDE